MNRLLLTLIASVPVGALPPAHLVLTPEFCRTQVTQGNIISSSDGPFRRDSFAVGEAACRQAEPLLRTVFAGLSVSASHQPIILTPRFANVSATRPSGPAPAFSKRELVVQIEWTARDSAGRIIWVETVQGSARRRSGNIFTKDRQRLIDAAVKDALERSALRMSEAAELKSAISMKAGDKPSK